MLRSQSSVNPLLINSKSTLSELLGIYSKNIIPQHKFHSQISTIQHQFCSESINQYQMSINQYQMSPNFTTTSRYSHQNFKEFQISQNFNYGLHTQPGLRTPSISTRLSRVYIFNTYTLSSSPCEDGQQQEKDTLYNTPQIL